MSNIFGGQQPTQPEQQEPTNTDPTNTNPNNPAPSEPGKEISPLDGFKDIWDIEPPKDGEISDSLEDVLTIDQQKIVDAVGQMDFSKAVDAETLSKIQAGGDEAVQATLQAMNNMVRLAFGQNMLANATLVKKAMGNAESRIDSRTNKLLRDSQIKSGVSSINPILNNPAVAPMVDMVQSQLAKKYPTASAEEVKQKTEELLTTFASQLNPSSQQSPNIEDEDGTDWEKFLIS